MSSSLKDLIRSYDIHTKCLSCIHKKACPYAFGIDAENDPCGEEYSHAGIEQLMDYIDKMIKSFTSMSDEEKRNGELTDASYYEGVAAGMKSIKFFIDGKADD